MVASKEYPKASIYYLGWLGLVKKEETKLFAWRNICGINCIESGNQNILQ